MSARPSSSTVLTDRQRKRLDEVEAELRERYGLVCSYPLVHLDTETRPGRGHDARIILGDGEMTAELSIDVYGNGSYAVARLDLIHNGFDDSCECEHCEREREDEP